MGLWPQDVGVAEGEADGVVFDLRVKPVFRLFGVVDGGEDEPGGLQCLGEFCCHFKYAWEVQGIGGVKAFVVGPLKVNMSNA